MSEYSLEGVLIKPALLILEDGTQSHGRAIGAVSSAVGEVVFDTSMTGYQEILINLSYSRQIVTLTYPHIDDVGINEADAESSQIHTQGLVIRDLPLIASNFRGTEDLSSYLKCHNIVAIADVDTCKLAHLLRGKGVQDGRIIVSDNPDAALALKKAKTFPGLNGTDLAKGVTTAGPYSRTQGGWMLVGDLPEAKSVDETSFHVIAYDFGAKRNVLRMSADHGCHPMAAPTKTLAEDVLKTDSDGIFLSNGSDDPTLYDYAATVIQKFLETDIPVFDICLGHQLLALASGAKITKMRFDHYSGNHPIKDVDNNTMMITTQGHGFAVDEAFMPANPRVTHRSLFDGILQRIHRTDKPTFSSQRYPEASPDPHDAAPLLDHSIELIE